MIWFSPKELQKFTDAHNWLLYASRIILISSETFPSTTRTWMARGDWHGLVEKWASNDSSTSALWTPPPNLNPYSSPADHIFCAARLKIFSTLWALYRRFDVSIYHPNYDEKIKTHANIPIQSNIVDLRTASQFHSFIATLLGKSHSFTNLDAIPSVFRRSPHCEVWLCTDARVHSTLKFFSITSQFT